MDRTEIFADLDPDVLTFSVKFKKGLRKRTARQGANKSPPNSKVTWRSLTVSHSLRSRFGSRMRGLNTAVMFSSPKVTRPYPRRGRRVRVRIPRFKGHLDRECPTYPERDRQHYQTLVRRPRYQTIITPAYPKTLEVSKNSARMRRCRLD